MKLCDKYFIDGPNVFSKTCRRCGMVVRHCNNTTNLWRHYKRQHKGLYENILRERQQQKNSRKKEKGVIADYFDTSDVNTEVIEIGLEEEADTLNLQNQTVTTGSSVSNLLGFGYATNKTLPASSASTSKKAPKKNSKSKSSSSTARNSKIAKIEQLQPKMSFCVDYVNSFCGGDQMRTKITEAIIYLIIQANLPFSIVEHHAFKYLMEVIVPNYLVPSTKTIRTAIDCKYDTLTEIKKQELQEVTCIALTADIWTESNNLTSIVGVTAHYIKSGVLKKIVLGSMEVTTNHTANNIALYFEKLLREWGLSKTQIIGVVTDSADNMVNAAMCTFNQNTLFPCFAQTLNLVVNQCFKLVPVDANQEKCIECIDEDLPNHNSTVQNSKDSESELEKIIKEIKYIIAWFHNSTIVAVGKKELEELHLLQSCSTRWNSTVTMVEKFLQISEIIQEVLLEHDDAPAMILVSDVAILKDILPILKIFNEVTVECSAEKFVLISRLIPLYNYMLDRIEKLYEKVQTETGKKFYNTALHELSRRFQNLESNYLCGIATLLDPRYKKLHFRSVINKSRAIDRLKKLIEEDILNSSTVGNCTSADKVYEVPENFESYVAQKNLLESSVITEEDDKELSLYLRAPACLKTDPLQFWEENKHTYPKLYKKVSHFLCIPGTSTPAERLSSIIGCVMADEGNRVTPESLKRLLFLKYLMLEDWLI